MKELIGDFWDHARKFDAIVVTTNGIVDSRGCLVMGAGIAAAFKFHYPWLPKVLGVKVLERGNHCYFVECPEQPHIISYPSKDHWRQRASIPLIERSARELVGIANALELKSILMTRPGCGKGWLRWGQVRPVIEPILDDRFVVASVKLIHVPENPTPL